MKATPPVSAQTAHAGVRRVLLITLGLNVAVSAAKVVVGKMSGSSSMVADGYHSLVDGSNNVVGLIVTGFAYAPPDEGHPYGHRKFETAAALLIGAGLLGLAYRVVVDALVQVGSHQLPHITILNWLVMGGTLLVNMFVAQYEAAAGRRLGSAYLMADAAHTQSDIYVTLGVAASFAGTAAGIPAVDAVVALGIAAFIGVLAARILAGAFHTLTDRAVLPAEDLRALVMGVPGVVACPQARTRGGAEAVYVDVVAEVDAAMTVARAHDVADAIEHALRAGHPQIVDVVVHIEPAGVRPSPP
jgi:cation diffusion facilitator family transporter